MDITRLYTTINSAVKQSGMPLQEIATEVAERRDLYVPQVAGDALKRIEDGIHAAPPPDDVEVVLTRSLAKARDTSDRIRIYSRLMKISETRTIQDAALVARRAELEFTAWEESAPAQEVAGLKDKLNVLYRDIADIYRAEAATEFSRLARDNESLHTAIMKFRRPFELGAKCGGPEQAAVAIFELVSQENRLRELLASGQYKTPPESKPAMEVFFSAVRSLFIEAGDMMVNSQRKPMFPTDSYQSDLAIQLYKNALKYYDSDSIDDLPEKAEVLLKCAAITAGNSAGTFYVAAARTLQRKGRVRGPRTGDIRNLYQKAIETFESPLLKAKARAAYIMTYSSDELNNNPLIPVRLGEELATAAREADQHPKDRHEFIPLYTRIADHFSSPMVAQIFKGVLEGEQDHNVRGLLYRLIARHIGNKEGAMVLLRNEASREYSLANNHLGQLEVLTALSELEIARVRDSRPEMGPMYLNSVNGPMLNTLAVKRSIFFKLLSNAETPEEVAEILKMATHSAAFTEDRLPDKLQKEVASYEKDFGCRAYEKTGLIYLKGRQFDKAAEAFIKAVHDFSPDNPNYLTQTEASFISHHTDVVRHLIFLFAEKAWAEARRTGSSDKFGAVVELCNKYRTIGNSDDISGLSRMFDRLAYRPPNWRQQQMRKDPRVIVGKALLTSPNYMSLSRTELEELEQKVAVSLAANDLMDSDFTDERLSDNLVTKVLREAATVLDEETGFSVRLDSARKWYKDTTPRLDTWLRLEDAAKGVK